MQTVQHILGTKHETLLSISPDADVFDALATMARHDVGALAVLDRGRLVGMFSERDYARKVILQGKTSRDTPVSAIMTTDVLTVDPRSTVQDCMSLMTDKRVRHLPVVEGEIVIGMISIGDVVKAVLSQQEFVIEQLQHYITA